MTTDLPVSLKNKKVAVLKGGLSAERSVSLKSGEMCANALRQSGLDIIELDVQENIYELLKAHKPDVCFNALHGRWGEDGCIQGLLEFLKIPYTHSGVLASSLSMDKQRSKFIYEYSGLQTPSGRNLTLRDIENGCFLDVPFVIKPVNDGSSVGIYIVHDKETFDANTLDRDRSWMIEAYIPGRELTVSILNDEPLGVTEIIPQGDAQWYDFNAKYAQNGSKHVLPAQLPNDVFQHVQDMALQAHQALGCHCVSRSDFRYNEKDGLYILETNTQPGMTPTSLLPEQAQACGLSFENLCLMILQTARLHT